MACRFYVPDGSNDERSGDLVELATAERLDHVPLEAALLVHVGNDAAPL